MSRTRSSPKVVQARYIMIGGFLGAGKTTAVGKLAQRLKDGGRKIGLITNNQGRNLVRNGFVTESSFELDASKLFRRNH